MPKQIEVLNYYFEEVEVGDWFKTPQRTVTETDLVMYSGLSGDYTVLHTDELFAKERGLKGRIFHGCLTLSIGTGLTYRLAGSGPSKTVAFYGMDKVRFTHPVYVGDNLYVEGEILSLEDKGEKGGVVTRKEMIKNQDDVLVAVLEKRTMVRHKPAS